MTRNGLWLMFSLSVGRIYIGYLAVHGAGATVGAFMSMITHQLQVSRL